VEFAVEQRAAGKNLRDATIEAARLRFRPILMTSFAFIMGVIPMAISTGAGANSRHAIGTGVIGGMLFGTFWLLVLGIAYRRRFNRSFWVKPVAWLFYGVFAVAAMWYAPRNIPVKLERFEPTLPAAQAMDMQAWWQHDWATLPARRNEFDDDQRWPLDVQVAGPLAPLQAQLEARG
ncbi:efflux RND transporter permease subunit, partial [Mesorhizobium sp. M8A.F.Ca.ET.142.01.1.1]|uniref:efflux RND transporter permease subunit n=1 Tax=Mesorhizobium sp. M8A.F.Ca.ET.142.01.1.1 TaxID=2563958 RepID=UPI001AEE22C9